MADLLQDRDREIEQLKEDMKEIKKKLIKLLRQVCLE